ncbi:hypothetical protein PP182_10360 [Maribacter sp. PR1]|uniref:Uncharacterized protein n=1 Tax=Maribacter cobaltidurans TaxID=1178778 RepID=A0ABU7IVC4_9FLAO|nr:MULTISPECIES: hypothetical protein [Maribacter]MDC6389084.1 hypothetical protein [Maribacter sp. PR1]MEE1976471.1 hypothetical protein [Maribacter cobaltidurans]
MPDNMLATIINGEACKKATLLHTNHGHSSNGQDTLILSFVFHDFIYS